MAPNDANRRKPTPRRRPHVKERQRNGNAPAASARTRQRGANAAPPSARERRRGDVRESRYSSESRRNTSASPAAAERLSLPANLNARTIGLAAIAIATIIVLIVAFGALAKSCSGSQENADDQAGGQDASAETPAFQRHEGPYSISFATTGDIMFGREVSTFVDANGGAAALANVAPQLAAADVTVANLECPLTNDESQALIGKDVLWRSNPKGIEGLKEAGVTIASLANNHIMDYGAIGLQDTLDALDNAGILHVGAGMTEDEAGEPVELDIDGVKIAFYSWTDVIPDNFLAFGDSAGVVSARMNMDDACKRVREAKETHDLVFVAMHWGNEYQPLIDEALQGTPAHKLVDAGADVIWGNHPHVIEGIEFYDGALISYSQGDFVCDHYSQETGESFILNFDVTQDGIENVTATPVYLDDTYGIPSIVTGDHAASILARLEEISAGMNSTFEVKDDVAYITPRRS